MTNTVRDLLIVVSLVAFCGGAGGMAVTNREESPLIYLASGVVAFGGLAVGVAIAFVVGFFKPKSTRPGMSADGRIGGYRPNRDELRYLDDREYEVNYQTPVSGIGGRRSKLLVRVSAPTVLPIRISSLRFLDRLGKFLRIARAVSTGDAAFENSVYVRARSGEYAAAILSSAEIRRSILQLFALGCREVRFTGKQLEAEWRNFHPDRGDGPRLADEAAAILVDIARRQPLDFGGRIVQDTTDRRSIAILVALALFASTSITLAAWPPMRGWDLFALSARDFTWNYLLFIVLAGLALYGTSTAHDRWFLLALIGIVPIGLGTCGAINAINFLADPGPFEERVETILHTSVIEVRSERTYYAHVGDWERPGQEFRFAIDVDAYHQIVPGRSQLQLRVGAGRFGLRWLTARTVVP